MFCHECGAKLEEGAAFCQECGAKVEQIEKSMEEPKAIDGMDIKKDSIDSKEKKIIDKQSLQIGMMKNKKNNNKKVPIIIGVILVFLIVLGIGIGLATNEENDNNFSNMTELTEVFENDDLSFEYPKAWEKTDDTGENCIVSLANIDIYSFISVWKFTEMPMTADSLYDIEDSYFVENYVTEDMNAVESVSLVAINDYPAREIIYSSADSNVGKVLYRSYFYAVDSVLYRVDLVKKETNPIDVDTVFDSVLNSYMVNADIVPDLNTNQDSYEDTTEDITEDITDVQEPAEILLEDIYFKDIPVSDFFEMSGDDIFNLFDGNCLTDQYGQIIYDDIVFISTDSGQVSVIDGEYPECFQVNGQILDSMDTVTQIFGNDYVEDGDSRTYYYPTYHISFGLDYFNVLIYRENVDTYNYMEVSGTTLEDYLAFGGTYISTMDGSSLGVGIYTSQEEGESEIGVAYAQLGDEVYFSGDLYPIRDNTFLIETGYEDEIILEFTYADPIYADLYVNGEYIEQYQMVEHYEP